MGKLVDKFVEWALLKRRWPLLFPYLGIPASFAFVTFYSGLSSLDAVGDQIFLMCCGVLLLVSGILYPAMLWPPLYAPPQKVRGAVSLVTTEVLRERSRRHWVGGFLALVGFILVLAGNLPPPISDDPLVVGIAKFTPVGGAEKEADVFKDSLINKLNAKEDFDPALLEVKNIASEVKGTMTDERKRFAKRLGRSWTNNVHILVGGKVIKRLGKDAKDGTYIAIYMAFVRPLRNIRIEEKEIEGNFQAEPELIEITEDYASNIADMAMFVYALAHYRAREWDRAIEIFEDSKKLYPTREAGLYKALCYYEKAQHASDPQQSLQGAISAFESVLGPRPWKLIGQEDEVTRAAYLNRANALAVLSQASEPKEALTHLREAKEAYQLALTLYSKDPHDQALIQNNLGNVLTDWASLVGGGDQQLLKAVVAYQAALKVYREGEANWAITQKNLGTALTELGNRISGDEGNNHLREALKAYNAALRVITYSKSRTNWALIEINLSAALAPLGSREGEEGNSHLQEAVQACQAALWVFPEGDLNWPDAKSNLGYALSEQGKRTSGELGTELLRGAIAACRDALRYYPEGSSGWMITQDILGRSSRELGTRVVSEEGNDLLRGATEAYQCWAKGQNDLGIALTELSSSVVDSQEASLVLVNAIGSFEKALLIYDATKYPHQHNEVRRNKERAESLLNSLRASVAR